MVISKYTIMIANKRFVDIAFQVVVNSFAVPEIPSLTSDGIP